jgi:Zn-dependent protease
VQGPTSVDATDARYSVGTTSEWAWSMWAAPFTPLVDQLEPRVDGHVAGTTDGAGRTTTGTHDDAQVLSIVGIAASTPHGVSDYGAVWVVLVVAGLSASVAGLNLLPAWGLDGYAILEEVAWWLGRYSERRRRPLLVVVGVIGVATAVLALWLVVGSVARDIAELL